MLSRLRLWLRKRRARAHAATLYPFTSYGYCATCGKLLHQTQIVWPDASAPES